MKHWETPMINNLALGFTKAEMVGWGIEYICTECCKTSNKDKNINNATHFHKGWCDYHPTNIEENQSGLDPLSTVVENTGNITCRNLGLDS